MAIDISILTAALQAKIDALDSNSAISDIVALERAAQQFGTTTYYDSDGDLPEATYFPKQSIVSTYSPPTVNVASKLYINNFGTWKEIQTFKTQVAFQGSDAGYVGKAIVAPITTEFAKFSFVSETDTTIVGSVAPSMGVAEMESYLGGGSRGASSRENGYVIGGDPPSWLAPPAPTGNRSNAVTQYSFASEVISRAGSLTDDNADGFTDGYSISALDYQEVYFGGGIRGTPLPVPERDQPLVKFPTANPWVSATVSVVYYPAGSYPSPITSERSPINGAIGIPSSTTGYVVGGRIGGPTTTVPQPIDFMSTNIKSFPFASATPLDNTRSLTTGKAFAAGVSSTTNGYVVGGYGPFPSGNPTREIIESFPFANPAANSVDAGNLSILVFKSAGMSSTTKGYSAAGAGGTPTLAIQSFPYSSFTTATTVANLITSNSGFTNTASFQQ